jgi:amino acid adenylation domain-containing protein
MQKLVSNTESLALHRRMNQTQTAYPDTQSVAELYEAAAERWPHAQAVVQAEESLSYGELNERANVLAWRLIDAGVQPGNVVSVGLPRSLELIVSLLAILKAGAAYLPVDLSWPRQRLEEVFHQAQSRWLLCNASSSQEPHSLRCIPVALQDLRVGSTDNPQGRANSQSIAYINFTSGSTGKPKGVPIQHRSIARLVFGARYAQLGPESRLLLMAPVTFDAATFEIWGALLLGGTCVLYPESFVKASRLQRVLEVQRITVLFLTTALFNALIDEAPQTLASVATILTGGEAHSLRHMRKALQVYGSDRIVSVYGPTESTTFATYYPVRSIAADETALPIGFPIQNTRVYVIHEDALCKAGEMGEIYLAGPGLSPGYLRMPELNAQRFLERDIGDRAERLYRTGDLGHLRADGAVVFQGRTDDQVKINGFRIELGEVAYHLNKHPEVQQSYVTVNDQFAEKYLLAFVVPRGPDCRPETLRQDLAASVPNYLVPARIELCERLPLSPTGKVDRGYLLSTLKPPGVEPHEYQ